MKWKLGQEIYYVYCDFDGCGIVKGIVTEINSDHCIMSADGINYWMASDDDNFFSNEKEAKQFLNKNKYKYAGVLVGEWI